MSHADDVPSLRSRLWLLITLSWLATAGLSALLLWSPGLHGMPVEERAALQLLGWAFSFGVVGAVLVIALRRLERWARRPLADFEHQIRQLADRQFIELQQPEVAEWVEMSRSINVLVARMRQMLADRDEAIRAFMSRLEQDELTGVASREYFMATLGSGLTDGARCGGVAMVRVHDLDGMNRRLGRSRTDEFLVAVSTALRAKTHLWPGADRAVLARLNGADFGLYLPDVAPALWHELVNQCSDALRALADERFTDGEEVAWIGATGWLQGETMGDVLGRVDNTLIRAAGRREPVCFAPSAARPALVTVAQWRVVIEQAIETGHLRLRTTPLCATDGLLLHHVGEIQLLLPDGTVLPACEVMPPAIRTGRCGDLDLKLVELGLRFIGETQEPLALTLAARSLARPSVLRRLGELLDRSPQACRLLLLELPDPAGQVESVAALKGLARLLGHRQVRLGVTRVGMSSSELPTLHSERVSYVKLHPSLLNDAQNGRRIAHLRHLWRVFRAQTVDVLTEQSSDQHKLRLMLSRGLVDEAVGSDV